MQSSGHAKSRGLLSLFSGPCQKMRTCPAQCWMLGLWRKLRYILDSPWRHVQKCHRRGTVCCRDGTVVQLAIFPEFRAKVGSGLLRVRRGAIALGRARIVVLLLRIGFSG